MAAGGLALGAASAVALGAAPSAGAVEPTVVAECLVSGGLESGRLRISGFPANTTLNFFVILVDETGGAGVFNGPGNFLTTDSTGSATSGSSPPGPENRPLDVGVAVYRDLNGNSRWDPGVDTTLYRGDGTVTACPSAVTLTPK